MPWYNPFSPLFETKKYAHARTLRTTFREKIVDAFNVLFNGIEHGRNIGISDYLTLGLPRLLEKWADACFHAREDDDLSTNRQRLALGAFCLIIVPACILFAARFMMSAAVVLVMILPIAVIHGIARLVAYHKTHPLYSTIQGKKSDINTNSTTSASFAQMISQLGYPEEVAHTQDFEHYVFHWGDTRFSTFVDETHCEAFYALNLCGLETKRARTYPTVDEGNQAQLKV